jgi:lipopolysaccharide cholinephosphotransferase
VQGKGYDERTLKTLQAILLKMLEDFDALCERHGIDYFIVGGTALGAVRHGGMIPWDDDIDVGMNREAYDAFQRVRDPAFNDRYVLLNPETDSRCPFPSTRWQLRGTVFRETCYRDVPLPLGIFLDVYCFDRIPDDPAAMRRQAWTAWGWGKLFVLRQVKQPALYFGGARAAVARLGCQLGHAVLAGLHVSPRALYRQASAAARRHRADAAGRIAFLFDPRPFTSMVRVEDIYPTRRIEFHGMRVKGPNRIEAYLSRRYGDYLRVPPVNQRHQHPPQELDFGPYAAAGDNRPEASPCVQQG